MNQEVAKAIQESGGCFTLLGVYAFFRCGCCEQDRSNPNYVGGVWTKGENGGLVKHYLVCKDCVNQHLPEKENPK